MLTLLLAFALDTQAPAREEAAILAAQDARFAAMVKGDASYLETALDPSLTYHHSSGSAQTRAEFMASIKAGSLKYKALDVIERKVRRVGSIAIITGIFRLQATNNGEIVDSKARFTDVYENKDGRWVQLAWQNTRIPEPPSSAR
ncbi:MAG TPA: nuclear transport factor 2 family protein [Vicinamibacteria bacterium]|nr:nuclear transport factor 2 family protein [Vicinamibacteria bacterium]